MREINIGMLQLHNTADTQKNIENIIEGIRDLASRGAELIVLQELHNSLYFCQVEDVGNFDMAEPIPGPSTEIYGSLSRECGVVLVTSLFEKRAAGLYHNTAVVFEKDGTSYESSDSEEEQQRQREAWTTVMRGHAVANGLPVVAVNRVGHESDPSGQTNGIQFWGSSFVAGPQGELHYQACDDDEESLIVSIDLDHSEEVRRWWPFLRDRRIENYGDIVRRFID